MSTAFELDFVLQLAAHKPPCRDCEDGLEQHDLQSTTAPCQVCDCSAYKPELCQELCMKPLGHGGPHYMK